MKLFSLFFLLFSSYLWGAAPLSQALVDKKDAPSKALVQTLDTFDLPHDNSWSTIISQTQSKWIRPAKKERWDVVEYKDSTPANTYTVFKNINMVDELHATEQCYDYAVVLGATLEKVRGRFDFLKKEWERGVRFKKLVVLTGDRPLNPEFEDKEHLINPKFSTKPFRLGWKFYGELPKNETEMMQMVFDQMVLPREWDSMTVVFVDTPQHEGQRPNTKDTFRHWLTSNPHAGSVLIVSDQPFLGRGDTLARKMLPKNFPVETIGEGISFDAFVKNKKAVPILLDELARWLYELRNPNPQSR